MLMDMIESVVFDIFAGVVLLAIAVVTGYIHEYVHRCSEEKQDRRRH